MTRHDPPTASNGGIDREKSPAERPALALVTCVENAPWRPLMPDADEMYSLFHMAWTWQQRWSREQHEAFWRSALPLWPRKRGNRQRRVLLGGWIWALRRQGYADAEIATALGYSIDALRRLGALRAADAEAEAMQLAKRRYDEWLLSGRDRDRLPYVKREGEEEPDYSFCKLAYEHLPDPDRLAADAVNRLGAQARDALAALRNQSHLPHHHHHLALRRVQRG